MFKVKELFYSLQGEGRYAGTPAVFCRFTGCNKWSGRAEDRAMSVCPFCDTDFVGGTAYSEDDLVTAIRNLWPGGVGRARVIFTGGEPTLQLTGSLIDKLKRLYFDVAIETNGSNDLPIAGPYWVTVSPKDTSIKVTRGHELKVLWPNDRTPPEAFAGLDFRHFLLQPIDDQNYAENLSGAVNYILQNPQWGLSLQQHKIVGLR